MEDRINWIDGMKGYACIIVFLGHSVACIFPNMIFGDAYMAHSTVERFFHMSPLSLIYSSGQMNGILFALSGWLIAAMFTEDVYVSYEKNVLNRVKKIITKLSGESNEKRGAICNFISKVP